MALHRRSISYMNNIRWTPYPTPTYHDSHVTVTQTGNKDYSFIIEKISQILKKYKFTYNTEIVRDYLIHETQITLMENNYNYRSPIPIDMLYHIVCDETNNTPDIVNKNCLVLDIYLTDEITKETDKLSFGLGFKKEIKRIYTEEDPYGEENWEED